MKKDKIFQVLQQHFTTQGEGDNEKIEGDGVILKNGEEEREIKTPTAKMNEDEKLEFVRLLKPLIWWGES